MRPQFSSISDKNCHAGLEPASKLGFILDSRFRGNDDYKNYHKILAS
jgi:hypothetical protein